MRLSLTIAALVLAVSTSNALAEEVLVGVDLPLTGAAATWSGPPMENGMRLAEEEINKSGYLGKGRTIKLLIGDDSTDKTQAITLVNRYINRDKVSLIIGPSTSPLATAAAPIANAAKVPLIGLGAGKSITEAGPWAFKMYQDISVISNELAADVLKRPKLKKIAVVVARDIESAVEYMDFFVKKLKEGGITDFSKEYILNSDSDFTALATKLVFEKPDAVLVAALTETSANVIVQLRQAGLDPNVNIYGSEAIGSSVFLGIGGAAVNGARFTAFYDPSLPAAAAFSSTYKAKFGNKPDAFSAIAYATVYAAADAIKAASPNASRAGIRDALAKLNGAPTILGKGSLHFSNVRSAEYGPVLMRWQNGEIVKVDK
jgi:branched-chain amino acid transport system substrate-binding protein